MSDWYKLESDAVLRQLNSDGVNGLSGAEAARRLAEYGPNELQERGIKSPWRILWEQLTATMVVILIVAAVVSAFLGDEKDVIVISAIVVINALLGFTQEYRAEKAIAALKKLAMPIVKVRRDGELREISSRELAPGDVILLETGMLVPADCRLLESVNLRVQEATLTGESQPVEKELAALGEGDLPLGDRRNMAYMGTVVTYGRGLGVVVATGMKSELGSIASMIQTVVQEATPLQRRLDQLGRVLAFVALMIVAVVFALGIWRGEDARLMFLTAVSMAVAAVPEGLPAVVTIALALGAQRMLKRKALIRKLPAVETLGSVTVICSDKTGTLTENRMTVTVLDVAGERVVLDERTSADQISREAREKPCAPALSLLLVGGALCNDAELRSAPSPRASLAPLPEGEGGAQFADAIGDPTESALVVAAARLGLRKDELEQALPRVAELPFDSNRKRMTTIHELGAGPHPELRSPLSQREREARGGPAQLTKFGVEQWGVESARYLAFTKGAVDSLLAICNSVWIDRRIEPMSADYRSRIIEANDRLAQNGTRVIGVAFQTLQSVDKAHLGSVEQSLTFVGMMGMIDPPRPEVKEAVNTCRSAGIRPVMITGDHPLTARAIAHQLGIADDGKIFTGQELDRLSLAELAQSVEAVSVYARVSPEHKLNIVQALQNRGHVVAMTGDGVNDAPALKKAEIGIAMGITGTDVSKEAADMVLLDDNFATIVAAVEEGRAIYDNIRKFIRYLMASNSAEIWVMLLAPFGGLPLPLLPLQILWINLVTDGLPALALSVEPAEPDTMRRPPNPPDEHIFSRGMGPHIIWVGLLMGAVSLAVGYAYWALGRPEWQTVVFTTLTFSQMCNVMAIRAGRASLFSAGMWSNKPLLGAVFLTFLLQLFVIYTPLMQEFFNTVALSLSDLLVSVALSTTVFWAVEIEKWIQRKRELIGAQATV